MVTKEEFLHYVEKATEVGGSISMYLPDPLPMLPNRTSCVLFHIREIADIGQDDILTLLPDGAVRYVKFSDMTDVQVFVL